MSASPHPPEARIAERAFASGEYDRARELYDVCVAKAALPGSALPPSFYLAEWARHEGNAGHREEFERLFLKAIACEPDAPLLASRVRARHVDGLKGSSCMYRAHCLPGGTAVI